MNSDADETLAQESATYGPRAGSGQPRHFTRPATIYCHPARDRFCFSIIVMQQQTAEMILISSSNRPNKGLNFWRRPFLFGLRHQFG